MHKNLESEKKIREIKGGNLCVCVDDDLRFEGRKCCQEHAYIVGQRKCITFFIIKRFSASDSSEIDHLIFSNPPASPALFLLLLEENESMICYYSAQNVQATSYKITPESE